MMNLSQEGEKEKWVCELGIVARHKRGLTSWRGGRGRSGLVSLEAWHVTNEDSRAGGEEEGGAGWRAWKRGRSRKRIYVLEGRMREKRVGALECEVRDKRRIRDCRRR